ncbi:alpha/beta hydrolase [Microbacterium sp. AGC62]
MPLDPKIAELLSTIPTPEVISDPLEHRATERMIMNTLAAQLAEPYPSDVHRTSVTIPVIDGEMELLIYVPPTAGPHPGFISFFGGGFRGGSVHYDYVDGTCRERCLGANVVVVSVGYRLAPERKFPSAVRDGYAALEWVANNASRLEIQPDALIIGGQSSGGNIAAAVAMWARDQHGPALALQVLEVPALDLTGQTNLAEYGTGFVFETAEFEQIQLDLFADPDDAHSPYASPILATDLRDLPPALILAAEYDLLRGGADMYAERLRAAGVAVDYRVAPGQIHASPLMTSALEAARTWRDTVIAALKGASGTQKVAA